MLWDMKEPIFVHTVSENEHEALEASLRSKDASSTPVPNPAR